MPIGEKGVDTLADIMEFESLSVGNDPEEEIERLAIVGLYKKLSAKKERLSVEHRLMGLPFDVISEVTNTNVISLRTAYFRAVRKIKTMYDEGSRNYGFGQKEMGDLEECGKAIRKERGIVLPSEKNRDIKTEKENKRAKRLSKKHHVV